MDHQVAEQIEIQAKYAGYIDRQQQEVERHRTQEATPLSPDFPYGEVRGLSTEVREKLSRVKPATLGQAARIPGVTPAAISLLLIHLRRRAA
jgi:tRNA uridine 5-carboxymethylaminomethyl modification enzyme